MLITGEILKDAKVLIVEDEPFIALDTALAVEQAGGIPIGPAGTVSEALEMIRRERPQAAILDVDLPDGTIDAVLEALYPEVPVIIYTGKGMPDHLSQVFSDVPVFRKPTPTPMLVENLNAIM